LPWMCTSFSSRTSLCLGGTPSFTVLHIPSFSLASPFPAPLFVSSFFPLLILRLLLLLSYSLHGAESFLRSYPGSQLVKKFPAFYGIRSFITAFTSTSHLIPAPVFIFLPRSGGNFTLLQPDSFYSSWETFSAHKIPCLVMHPPVRDIFCGCLAFESRKICCPEKPTPATNLHPVTP
jgi:hypothetical protein